MTVTSVGAATEDIRHVGVAQASQHAPVLSCIPYPVCDSSFYARGSRRGNPAAGRRKTANPNGDPDSRISPYSHTETNAGSVATPHCATSLPRAAADPHSQRGAASDRRDGSIDGGKHTVPIFSRWRRTKNFATQPRAAADGTTDSDTCRNSSGCVGYGRRCNVSAPGPPGLPRNRAVRR